MLSWQNCNFAASMPMFCICNGKHNYFNDYNYVLVAVLSVSFSANVCVSLSLSLSVCRKCNFWRCLLQKHHCWISLVWQYTQHCRNVLYAYTSNQPTGKVSCTIFPLNFLIIAHRSRTVTLRHASQQLEFVKE